MRTFEDYPKARLSGNICWSMLTGRRERSRRWRRPCRNRKLRNLALRQEIIRGFAHTLPDPDTVSFVVSTLLGWHWKGEADGVVSIGAGTGYWEALIALSGFRVDAFDVAPPDRQPNEYHDTGTAYYPIELGGPETAAGFPKRVLMMAWPPPGRLAIEALIAYSGKYLLYMGAMLDPEQNGDDEFFLELLRNWEMVAGIEPVRWQGSRDFVIFFKRRPPGVSSPCWLHFDLPPCLVA